MRMILQRKLMKNTETESEINMLKKQLQTKKHKTVTQKVLKLSKTQHQTVNNKNILIKPPKEMKGNKKISKK